jgi:hypothetical protein
VQTLDPEPSTGLPRRRARVARPAPPFSPALERLRLAVQLIIALILAVFAQLAVAGGAIDALLLFIAAVVVFIWALERERTRPWPEPETGQLPLPAGEPAPARWESLLARPRLITLAIVLALGAVAWLAFGGNRFTFTNVSLWLAALVLFASAFVEWPQVDLRSSLRRFIQSPSVVLRVSPVLLALTGIVIVAAAFRFYELDRTPFGMVSDHAEKLLDVNDVLHGQFSIFFPRNTGREAFQFYLIAATVKLFDMQLGYIPMKLGTALFGVLTIPWIYLLGKELFDRRIGLLAAAFVAISLWAEVVARMGLRYPFTPAFAAPTLYFLVRGFKYNRRNDWLLCGLFLGLGLHTYTPFRIVPVLLVVLVALKLAFDLVRRRFGTRAVDRDATVPAAQEASSLTPSFWINAGLAGILAALVFLPLGRYAVDNPNLFWYRALTRSTGVEREVAGLPLVTFLENNKNALLMFNYRGDVSFITNVPGDRTVDAVTGALMVLGMAYVLWRLFRYRDRTSLYLLAMVFLLLFPTTSNTAFPIENPSVVRASGAIAVVFFFAALPLGLVASRLWRALGGLPYFAPYRMAAVAVLVAVPVLFAARLNFDWYFGRYDTGYRAAVSNELEMGAVVRGFADSVGDLQHAYVIAAPFWIDVRLVGIAAGDVTWQNLLTENQIPTVKEDRNAKLFLVNQGDAASLDVLRQTFPEGSAHRYISKVGRDFMVFLAPAAT